MSGMEYGVYCSGMVRFPHVEYVDTLITAAMHGHLYKTGTGPRCVWEGDEFDGVWVHPDTSELSSTFRCLSRQGMVRVSTCRSIFLPGS